MLYYIITRVYVYSKKEAVYMRVKFTTNFDSELLEKIKIQAVKEKTDVCKILEILVEQYLKDVSKKKPQQLN